MLISLRHGPFSTRHRPAEGPGIGRKTKIVLPGGIDSTRGKYHQHGTRTESHAGRGAPGWNLQDLRLTGRQLEGLNRRCGRWRIPIIRLHHPDQILPTDRIKPLPLTLVPHPSTHLARLRRANGVKPIHPPKAKTIDMANLPPRIPMHPPLNQSWNRHG